MQGFLHCAWPLRMYFWVIFTLKMAITHKEITWCWQKHIYTCSWDYLLEPCPTIPGQCNISFIVFGLWECIFELFLIKKCPQLSRKLLHRKKIKLVLKTTYKKLVLKYQGNARFSSLCLASENVFLSFFTQKMPITRVANYCIEKKIKLVPKTTYKKPVLKYQGNARFPS